MQTAKIYDTILKAEKAMGCSTALYAVLGQYGNELSDEVSNAIRKDAEDYQKEAVKFQQKVLKLL